MSEKVMKDLLEGAGTGREADFALARACICRALKLGLANPNPHSLEELLAGAARKVFVRALLLLDEEATVAEGPALWEGAELPPVSFEAFREAHARLFGHAARGKVCPYETEYGGDAIFLQSQILADIAGYFLAFGLEPSRHEMERVDHIAVELEFLEFLSEKEFYAIEIGDASTLAATKKAYRSFLRDHLARFGPAFCASLLKEEGEGIHGMLARLCRAFLAIECRRLGIPFGPEFLSLRPDSLDDAPMACGSGSDLVQIE